MTRASPRSIPDDFLWGAATSSHQVEGGNRRNDWWALEEAGRLPHRSGDACRHYELYEQDFKMASAMGHNAHRLSIEWSRIEPVPGRWDEDALEHYRDVIDSLHRHGLEPVVTLHHFTNPHWFAERGGWTRSDSPALFARYAAQIASHLAGRVRFWLTVNEPTVYVKRAYVSGEWPPCAGRSWGRAMKAMRNLARAHVAAYRKLHDARSDVMVGLAHSAPYVVPCRPDRWCDRVASAARDFALNRSLFLLLGRDPRSVLDYIGINYYTRQVIRWRPAKGEAAVFGTECTEDHHGPRRKFSTLGWEVFAPGMLQVLRRFRRYGLPMMITENGIATDDEQVRSRFLEAHVDQVRDAVREGIPLLGYLYWTLMDNYEWSEGPMAKFGLAETNFSTQERSMRPAGRLFSRLRRAAPQ